MNHEFLPGDWGLDPPDLYTPDDPDYNWRKWK